MNVLIWTDMEGISGVTVVEQILPEHFLYPEGRRLYTEDINAAARGAFAAGATTIVVREAHGGHDVMGVNHVIPEILDEHCDWVSHHYGPAQPWLDIHYDACVMVGMHARWGTPDGILCHTISGGLDIYLNEKPVGEIEVFGRMMGGYDTPVVAVTGDTATCAEAEALIPNVTAVAVKQGYTFNSGQCIAPLRARKMIEEQVKTALQSIKTQPILPPSPAVWRVKYNFEGTAEKMTALPGVSLIDKDTIRIDAGSYNAGLNRIFGWPND
jgi:D-amino peptidase